MALDFNIIGQRLKKARLNQKLTQENLSEIINISVSQLSKFETGKAQINLKRLSQICDILGVTEGYILNGSSNTSKTYLSSEFASLLIKTTPEKQKLIYKIAQVISEN